ncbi:MAG: toll/interleukin-1 receptor domain-containing protein [Desulfobulbaceae bacterium]|nr:toll/interleukin-1 receptor domain-containing protein [Desulfobulbaceae bacterium]
MSKLVKKRDITIFYSYAHADWRMQKNLHRALESLQKAESFRVLEWYDGLIRPGYEWEPSIIENLKRADIILLLLSPAFIDSQYCYEKELELALRRHSEGLARVIPVLLRDVAYRERKFSPFQAIPQGPRGAKPVEKWRPRSEAWGTILLQLKQEIEDLIKGGPVTDARNFSRSMQSMSAEEIEHVISQKSMVLREFRSVMEFWDQREQLRSGDLVTISGTFSEFAPLLIGYPKAKRRLHREFRRAIERLSKLARKKMRTMNACMSISASQMVWRDRHATDGGVNCGLYESIIRNSIPVYVTREHYESELRNLEVIKGVDTFQADVTGRVTKRDMSRMKDYIVKYGMDAFIPKGVIDDLCKDSLGLLVDGNETLIDYKSEADYLDGDIWVAGETGGNEFFVTEFLDIGSPKDREEALQDLREELDGYPGSPRLLGQYDEISELAQYGFNVLEDEGPLKEIYKYGFDVLRKT